MCDGASYFCPPDVPAPAGKLCRTVMGACDTPEYCNGVSKECGLDILDFGNTCRESTGPCDPAELCNGGLDCPADVISPPGTVCGNPAACELKSCNGADGQCHLTGYRGAQYNCRPSTGPCDTTETCGTATTNSVFPECRLDVPKTAGTSCTSGSLIGKCNGFDCTPQQCSYSIQCPDGYACNAAHQCELVPQAAGGYGASCTGNAVNLRGTCATGLICCSGMTGDGLGGATSSGATGRCQECCNNNSTTFTDCGDLECCDGKCVDVTKDKDNCMGCGYNPGGMDCDDFTNGCDPQAVGCDGNSGCRFAGNSCKAGQVCKMPVVPYVCTDLSNPFCFQKAITGTVDPRCLVAPFTDCPEICETVPTTPQCISDSCDTNSDCCAGTKCVISCSSKGNAYFGWCFNGSSCQLE